MKTVKIEKLIAHTRTHTKHIINAETKQTKPKNPIDCQAKNYMPYFQIQSENIPLTSI